MKIDDGSYEIKRQWIYSMKRKMLKQDPQSHKNDSSSVTRWILSLVHKFQSFFQCHPELQKLTWRQYSNPKVFLDQLADCITRDYVIDVVDRLKISYCLWMVQSKSVSTVTLWITTTYFFATFIDKISIFKSLTIFRGKECDIAANGSIEYCSF